jgi:hypothetical protein
MLVRNGNLKPDGSVRPGGDQTAVKSATARAPRSRAG